MHLKGNLMYRIPKKEPEFEKFDMIFGGTLNRENRWVVLGKAVFAALCSKQWTAGLAGAGCVRRAHHQRKIKVAG